MTKLKPKHPTLTVDTTSLELPKREDYEVNIPMKRTSERSPVIIQKNPNKTNNTEALW